MRSVVRAPRWRALLLVLALMALVVAACKPVHRPGGWWHGPRAEADAPGPYQVGRTTFTVSDPARAGRTLTVDAWYPVDARDAAGVAPSQYDLLVAAIESPTALDAPPVSRRGGFPLVVFSHGSGGVRFQSWFLTEHLASHGFVVVAPDHAGNTAYDQIFGTTLPFQVMSRERPLDVSFVISTMLARAADRADPFAGRIDPRRVGVVGHSFGAFTALAVASGFQDIPADPRVRSIVPISPASSALSDAELAGIRTPTLLLGGTADVTTPIVPQTERPWALLSARPAYRVDVRNAGHASFTNICDLRDALLGAGLPPNLLQFLVDQAEEGCAPNLIPIGEAQRITNLYTTAFLATTLGTDRSHQRVFAPPYPRLRQLPVDYFRK
jgi:predicted dienelactone hydrolase